MKPLKLKLFQELFERVRPDEQMETHPVSFNRLPFLFLSEAHHIFVVNLNLLSEQLMKIEKTFLSKTETVVVFP
jgi:hypothetical protein